jgi:hypothetical protein
MIKRNTLKVLFFGLINLLFTTISAGVINPDSNFKPGFYLDAEVGVSDTNYQSIKLKGVFQPTSVTQVGLAPRFTFGYDFDRYVGTELNVIYFQRPHLNGLGFSQVTRSIKHNIVSLLLKASLPLQNWDITAKGGLGYVVRGNLTLYGNYGDGNPWDGDYTALVGGQFLCPVYGITIDRRFTTHWAIDVSWIQAPAESQHQLPVSNFYGVGASYKF